MRPLGKSRLPALIALAAIAAVPAALAGEQLAFRGFDEMSPYPAHRRRTGLGSPADRLMERQRQRNQQRTTKRLLRGFA